MLQNEGMTVEIRSRHKRPTAQERQRLKEKKNHTICQTSRPLVDKTAEIHTENHTHTDQDGSFARIGCVEKRRGSLRFLVQVQNRATDKSQNEEEKRLKKTT